MNWTKIKMEAKSIIRGNLWNILLPYIITVIISLGVSLVMTYIIGTGTSEEVGGVISLIASLALYPMELGALNYVMNFVRKESYDLNILFNYYKKFFPVVGLMILISIFVGLWTLAFIIPGIVASYSYIMAPYLMVDGEEDPMECIRKSKNMMKGYKMDYFIFQLSFVGWIILSAFTFGILFVYVIPYINVSQILYYEELRKLQSL